MALVVRLVHSLKTVSTDESLCTDLVVAQPSGSQYEADNPVSTELMISINHEMPEMKTSDRSEVSPPEVPESASFQG